jgi:hypothetical protein
MAAATREEFTVSIPVDNANGAVRVELRQNGNKWWARATSQNIAASGISLGTVKLEKRQRQIISGVADAWSTAKSKTVISGSQVWTDENYDPPASTTNYTVEICASLTRTSGAITRSKFRTV